MEGGYMKLPKIDYPSRKKIREFPMESVRDIITTKLLEVTVWGSDSVRCSDARHYISHGEYDDWPQDIIPEPSYHVYLFKATWNQNICWFTMDIFIIIFDHITALLKKAHDPCVYEVASVFLKVMVCVWMVLSYCILDPIYISRRWWMWMSSLKWQTQLAVSKWT